ncbi:aquaporin AQPAe.a-like isoform X3 [Zootermopsis nevadensis]|uniref:aquaporin AQPAe.a-like isoform X3 n=1 Tax=Zootermopsis nevadensis TaxID=136037 RepID=UPI000B8E7768|nr:aquaporin AQPAe.a-like isoform X3 [Zootermopsis nevadensis]
MVNFSANRDIFGPYTHVEVIQRCVGEMLGTFALVFLGCMGVGVHHLNPSVPEHYFIACFNFGLAVMVPILIVGHISQCHMNPAITLTVVISDVMKPALAGLYIISQCIGSVLGYGVLYGLTPMFHNKNPPVCVTVLHKELNVFAGMAMEAFCTGLLCLVVCGVLDKRNAHNTDSTAIKIGLTVSSLALVEAPYTMASFNPARSLGPCVWTGHWENHWFQTMAYSREFNN